MFDALCMSNFCRAVYLRWNEHCGQFSASCNIEIQKKLFLHKQALNHVWFTLYVQFLPCCLIWDEMKIVNSFQQVATLKYRKNFFCINKLYKSCLMHSVCPIFAVLSIWDEINIVNSFQQIATLKYRKNFFCINKL